MMENIHNENYIPSPADRRKPPKLEDLDEVDKDFNFDDYAEEHHLESLSEYAKYAKEHKLKLRNMAIKV